MTTTKPPDAPIFHARIAQALGLFQTKIFVTFDPITSEQATNGQRCSSYRSGPLSSQGEADREGAC